MDRSCVLTASRSLRNFSPDKGCDAVTVCIVSKTSRESCGASHPSGNNKFNALPTNHSRCAACRESHRSTRSVR